MPIRANIINNTMITESNVAERSFIIDFQKQLVNDIYLYFIRRRHINITLRDLLQLETSIGIFLRKEVYQRFEAYQEHTSCTNTMYVSGMFSFPHTEIHRGICFDEFCIRTKESILSEIINNINIYSYYDMNHMNGVRDIYISFNHLTEWQYGRE